MNTKLDQIKALLKELVMDDNNTYKNYELKINTTEANNKNSITVQGEKTYGRTKVKFSK